MGNNINIKPLPLEFDGRGKVKGYLFKQIKASDNAYIYAVYNKDNMNRPSYYEVFRKYISHWEIKGQEGYNVKYPGDECFGYWAKTTKDYEKALEYFYMYDIVKEMA